jgi:hypothetical protein
MNLFKTVLLGSALTLAVAVGQAPLASAASASEAPTLPPATAVVSIPTPTVDTPGRITLNPCVQTQRCVPVDPCKAKGPKPVLCPVPCRILEPARTQVHPLPNPCPPPKDPCKNAPVSRRCPPPAKDPCDVKPEPESCKTPPQEPEPDHPVKVSVSFTG